MREEARVVEDLIVVASHGPDHIEKCLDSLMPSVEGGGKSSVLVVDTKSSDVQHLFPLLKKHASPARESMGLGSLPDNWWLEKFNVGVTPFKGYTTGAYLWAYWHYPAKNYLFMQDSMEAITEDYLAPFKEKQPERGAVAWCKFKEDFDSPEQKAWAHYILNSDPDWEPNNHEYLGEGIFGPVFYVSKETLDELSERGLLPPTPTTKYQSQGMERIWPWLFSKAGMPVESLSGYWDAGKMERGELDGIFKKTFADRR